VHLKYSNGLLTLLDILLCLTQVVDLINGPIQIIKQSIPASGSKYFIGHFLILL